MLSLQYINIINIQNKKYYSYFISCYYL